MADACQGYRLIRRQKRRLGFLLDHHRDAAGSYRTSRDGSAAKFAAFLDDYAFLADALLELGWAARRPKLSLKPCSASLDRRRGLYFTAPRHGI